MIYTVKTAIDAFVEPYFKSSNQFANSFGRVSFEVIRGIFGGSAEMVALVDLEILKQLVDDEMKGEKE